MGDKDFPVGNGLAARNTEGTEDGDTEWWGSVRKATGKRKPP